MTPYYVDAGFVIFHGDALEVLADLSCRRSVTVDSVVTDPPYASGSRTEASKSASGAMVRNARFQTPIENDQMTTTGFVWLLRQTAMACRPMLPEGGSFLSFIDWRQWPNLVGAFETCNYRVQAMIVWDKGSIGMGNGFRAQHELICHASKGVPTIHDRSCGNVLRADRQELSDHPSPKPKALMARLIEVVTPPGGVVLDPFMGAGTSLRAARDVGRKGIGIEYEERYCEIAAKRLAQEVLAI